MRTYLLQFYRVSGLSCVENEKFKVLLVPHPPHLTATVRYVFAVWHFCVAALNGNKTETSTRDLCLLSAIFFLKKIVLVLSVERA